MNLDSHRTEAFWENVEFLREQGMTDEQIARRLGVTMKTFEQKRLRRDKEKR